MRIPSIPSLNTGVLLADKGGTVYTGRELKWLTFAAKVNSSVGLLVRPMDPAAYICEPAFKLIALSMPLLRMSS